MTKYIQLPWFLLLIAIVSGHAQQSKIDSLRHLVKDTKDTAEVNLYISLSWQYSQLNPDSAEWFAMQAFTLSDSLNFTKGKARALSNLGSAMRARGQLRFALDTYLQALSTWGEVEDQSLKRIAGLNHNIANVYFDFGEYNKALEYRYEALTIFESIKDGLGIAHALTAVGVTFHYQSAYDRAITHYMRSLAIYENLGNIEMVTIAISNIAEAYSDSQQFDSALFFHTKALSIALDQKHLRNEATIRSEMGKTLLQLGELSEANKQLMLALDLNESVENGVGTANNLLYLAQCDFTAGDLNQSLERLDQAMAYYREENLRPLMVEAYLLSSQLYSARGEFALANKYRRLFQNLYDSLQQVEIKRYMLRTQALYERAKKEEELAVTVKENEKLKGLKADAEFHQTIAVICTLVIAIFVVLLYTSFSYRSKVKSAENDRLQAQVDFKNRELTASALYLSTKNSLLTSIKTELGKETKHLQEELRLTLNKITKFIDENLSGDKDWEKMKFHFEQVHPKFFGSLKKRFPGLTQNELKHCAYIRINLSTKEVARLLNVTNKSVQISRYRLKKKLLLSEKDSLSEFISMV